MSLERTINDDIKSAMIMKILNKLAKQRKDSMQIYKDQSRDDLYAVEEQELNVIAEYLPEQMSEEDVKSTISEIISNSGASSMADMGKVMGLAMGKLNGKADGKVISGFVKELLS